jgi:hypothetical protein
MVKAQDAKEVVPISEIMQDVFGPRAPQSQPTFTTTNSHEIVAQSPRVFEVP